MCEEEIQVRDSAEYPPVKVCEKNPRYAMAMLSNIGARDVCSQSVFLQQFDRKWQV